MAQRALSAEGARAVFAVLLLLGASPSSKENFIYQFTQSGHVPGEWRFGGVLGGGGKLYLESERWRVGCYREDDTPERTAKITAANEVLDVLRQRFAGGDTFERVQEALRHQPHGSSPCRFCGASTPRGAARCSSCSRTMWDDHERWLQESTLEDAAAELEIEETIDRAIASGGFVELDWTRSRARALRRRASSENVTGLMDVTFFVRSETGPWAVRLRPGKPVASPTKDQIEELYAEAGRVADDAIARSRSSGGPVCLRWSEALSNCLTLRSQRWTALALHTSQFFGHDANDSRAGRWAVHLQPELLEGHPA